MLKKISVWLIIPVLLLSLCACKTETVKFDYFDNAFSPFFMLSSADMSVNAMLQETILVTAGEDGEKLMTAYSDGKGIADIIYDDSDRSKLICDIKIGEDITFSDGTPMTADDVIFSMYVYADIDYEGWSGFGVSKIDGLKNYRYNNDLAEKVTLTTAQLDMALANPDEELSALIKEKVMEPILEDEMEWVKRVYNDSAYIGTELGQYMGIYPDAKDLFAYLYSIDENYDSKTAADCDQVLEDIKKQYGSDYETLGNVLGEIDLSSSARRCAEEIITANTLKTTDGKPVDSIRGIEKIDEKTVRVTINSQEDADVQTVLGIFVAPLHHYGSTELYDYENSNFGFTRGDLSAVREKNVTPLGAGRYTLEEYDGNSTAIFKKNKNYYRNCDGGSKVIFEATGNSSESKVHGYFVSYDNYTYFKD